MSTFPNSEKLYQVLKELFIQIENQAPDATQEILDTKLAIRMRLMDPKAGVFINAKKEPLKVDYGWESRRPDLDVEMEADLFHNIMLGSISLKKAFSSGKLKLKGPFWKSFALENLFKSGQSFYPQIIKEQGLDI